MLKNKMLELEQFILDSCTCIEYPQNLEALADHWSRFLLHGQYSFKIESLSDKQKEKIKASTFPILIKHNSQAIKTSIQIFINIQLNQAIQFSLRCTTMQEFSTYWSQEVNSFENLLSTKLSEFSSMLLKNENKFFKCFNIYTKGVENFLLSDEFFLCSDYREIIVTIFWTYENNEVLNKLLYRPADKQQKEFNEYLVMISKEIKAKKEGLLANFPDKIFDRYFQWFLVGIKDEWKKSVERRDSVIEENFINASERIIGNLCNGSMKIFDSSLCAEEVNNLVLDIFLCLVPEKLLPKDKKLEKLMRTLGGPNFIFADARFRDVSKLPAYLEFFWEITNQSINNLLITSFAFCLISTESIYTPVHRQLLQSLISYLLFPIPKLHSPLLLFLEHQIPNISKNYSNNPTVFYIERKQNNKIPSVFSSVTKKKSLKLVNIRKKNTASSLIIIPNNSEKTENFNKKFGHLTEKPWNSETFIFKWNPILAVAQSADAVPGMMMAGFHAYYGNIFSALGNAIGAIAKVDFNSTKAQAKNAGIRLAQCISSEEYFKKHPVCLYGEESGCEVVFYCLKELSRKGEFVHDVILIGGVNKNVNSWNIAIEAVAGRLIFCYTKAFRPLNVLQFKNPLKVLKGENSKIENFDISKISNSREILTLIGY